MEHTNFAGTSTTNYPDQPLKVGDKNKDYAMATNTWANA